MISIENINLRIRKWPKLEPSPGLGNILLVTNFCKVLFPARRGGRALWFSKMIKDNIKIEKASIDDAEQILEIQKAAFLGQARIYNNYQLPPLTQSLESIRDEFKEKTFLKVQMDGQILASLRFKVIDDYVTIDRVVVRPHYQNQGIGTILLNEVESRVPGAIAFQLFTGNKSIRNIHLYEKAGFKVIESRTDAEGIELLYMEKRP